VVHADTAAADLSIGDAINEDPFVAGDLLDRAQDWTRGLVQERQRVEQAGLGLGGDVSSSPPGAEALSPST
jgi:hypothetical protein